MKKQPDEVYKICQNCGKLIKWKENLTCVNNSLQICIPKIEECKQIIKIKEEEYHKLLKDLKVCPLCKQEIKWKIWTV